MAGSIRWWRHRPPHESVSSTVRKSFDAPGSFPFLTRLPFHLLLPSKHDRDRVGMIKAIGGVHFEIPFSRQIRFTYDYNTYYDQKHIF